MARKLRNAADLFSATLLAMSWFNVCKEIYIDLTLPSVLIFAQESHGLSSGRIRTKTFTLLSCVSSIVDSLSDIEKFVWYILSLSTLS